MELNGYNSGGHGPASSLKVETADGKPSAPTKLHCTVYGKYVRVHWGKPSDPNGEITQYRVFISGTTPKSVLVNGDVTSFVFDDLDPDTEHEISVEASTKEGFGEKATETVFTNVFMGRS